METLQYNWISKYKKQTKTTLDSVVHKVNKYMIKFLINLNLFSIISGSVIRVLVMCVWTPLLPFQWDPLNPEKQIFVADMTTIVHVLRASNTYCSGTTGHGLAISTAFVSKRRIIHTALKERKSDEKQTINLFIICLSFHLPARQRKFQTLERWRQLFVVT